MRLLIISSAAVVAVVVLFIAGVVLAAPALSAAMLCAWSPVLVLLGWSLHAAGIRVVLGGDHPAQRFTAPGNAPAPRPIMPRQARIATEEQ